MTFAPCVVSQIMAMACRNGGMSEGGVRKMRVIFNSSVNRLSAVISSRRHRPEPAAGDKANGDLGVRRISPRRLLWAAA